MSLYGIRVALPGKVLPPSHTRGCISEALSPPEYSEQQLERVLAGMDIRAEQVYSEYRASVENRRQRVQRGWALAKQTTWLALLAGGYLMFYLLDLLGESFQLMGMGF